MLSSGVSDNFILTLFENIIGGEILSSVLKLYKLFLKRDCFSILLIYFSHWPIDAV